MIDKAIAEQARDHIVEAIKQISLSVRLIEGRFPSDTLYAMRRTAGLAIGTLDTEYLAYIFAVHPDLDDLTEREFESGPDA